MLDLSKNQLTALPPEIGKLTDLQRLYLNSNQLPEIPPEIMARSNQPSALVSYYFDQVDASRKGESRPLNEAKMVLVGEPKVGKTCLRKRLLHDTFAPQEPMTLGIDIDQ